MYVCQFYCSYISVNVCTYVCMYACMQVLSDENQREVYDRYGEEGLKDHHKHGGGDMFSR